MSDGKNIKILYFFVDPGSNLPISVDSNKKIECYSTNEAIFKFYDVYCVVIILFKRSIYLQMTNQRNTRKLVVLRELQKKRAQMHRESKCLILCMQIRNQNVKMGIK